MRIKLLDKEHVLLWASLALIIVTGILEYYSPQGVFLSWGYIVALLLSVLSGKRINLFISSVLAVVCVIISFFKVGDALQFETFVLNRAYALLGLLLTSAFLIAYIKKEMKSSTQRSLMAGIFSHGTQGIILTKPSGEIIITNPYIQQLFGYGEHELLNKNIRSLLNDVTFSDAGDSGPLASRSELRKDVMASRSDGTHFPAEITSNYYQSSGKTYVATFLTDITSRKENEQALLQKKNELEIVNQQLEAFSYSVSHDLRSPLRAVGGYATMLKEDYAQTLDAEANRLIRNIETSAFQMGLLIDDLLTFSRLGRKAVRKSEIDMTAITTVVVEEINKTFKNNAQVTISPLHRVMADASLMRQVMFNLLSNAIKYSSKNDQPKIEVSSVLQHDAFIFSVKDNGVGFDMNYSHKLFQVFQRLHMESEFEGTGVGLAIAQRIIQKHEGKIWAEAQENIGATFYFSLPAALETKPANNSGKIESHTTSIKQS